MIKPHSHYYKSVEHLREIDVYRVLKLFDVTDPCIAHAVKKLLVAGGRGAGKGMEQDIREAVDSLNRALQMIAEDCNQGVLTVQPYIPPANPPSPVLQPKAAHDSFGPLPGLLRSDD